MSRRAEGVAEGDPASVSATLAERIGNAIDTAGGWIPFSRFMSMALYEPGLGYYASGRPLWSRMPEGGGDFITAPELSPLFGRALAVQVGEALDATGTREVFEFGAGSGALARELLESLGDKVERYSIVELSSPLRKRQLEASRAFASKVRWLDSWPDAMSGVVVGNEVLDAMPVDVVRWDGSAWLDRGVSLGSHDAPEPSPFVWCDRPATRAPDIGARALPAGFTTETHAHADAFVATLAGKLERGAAFFIDYGFPAGEYRHPQRAGGTIACHRGHRVDFDPLADVGEKDITAHVDFTGIALAGQDAGFDVAGYTSQARFLLNCGVGELLAAATPAQRADAQRLLLEHEMGELFKIIAFTRNAPRYAPIGFTSADRRHRL